ncbi:MAG: hypothetical protein MI867_14920, partial [Pseudomonadales bacterium]|nr:hypothetical protein [Pseudomonadales bacterium]
LDIKDTDVLDYDEFMEGPLGGGLLQPGPTPPPSEAFGGGTSPGPASGSTQGRADSVSEADTEATPDKQAEATESPRTDTEPNEPSSEGQGEAPATSQRAIQKPRKKDISQPVKRSQQKEPEQAAKRPSGPDNGLLPTEPLKEPLEEPLAEPLELERDDEQLGTSDNDHMEPIEAEEPLPSETAALPEEPEEMDAEPGQPGPSQRYKTRLSKRRKIRRPRDVGPAVPTPVGKAQKHDAEEDAAEARAVARQAAAELRRSRRIHEANVHPGRAHCHLCGPGTHD